MSISAKLKQKHRALAKAVAAGEDLTPEQLAAFDHLRDDPTFQELVERIRQGAELEGEV